MQKKKIMIAFVAILSIWYWTDFSSEANNPVTIDQLIESSQKYDNQEITLTGEVIGKPMVRGNKIWVNMNDGKSAIGVFVQKSKLPDINHYGNYDYHGDQVQVTGTFHKACSQHGGETDIHGEQITILEAGKQIPHLVSAKKIVASVFAIIIAGGMAGWYYHGKKKDCAQ